MRDHSLADGGSGPVAADVDADADDDADADADADVEEQNYQCAGCNRPKQSDYEKLPEWAKLTPSDDPGHLMQPVVRFRNPEHTIDRTKPTRVTKPVVSNTGQPVLYHFWCPSQGLS